MKRRIGWGITVVSLLIALLLTLGAYAATYGSGPYGTCAYETDCGPSTVVTVPPAASTSTTTSPSTPTPLQVNINLTNGQVIPRSGYTILVTPLNGRGSSFASVDFYIDSSLVHSQTPDEEGTVSWFWNVGDDPGTDIKVVITGQAGQTVSRTFSVELGTLNTPAPASSPSVLQQIISAPKHLVQSVARSVVKLPKQVKYELPYFLFLLLGGDILLLLFRTRHEIAESKRLQALLARERQNAELKRTFTELISHYLRTPLTIIIGSLDLRGPQQTVAEPALRATHDTAQLLSAAIDDLLGHLTDKNDALTSSVSSPARPSIWRRPGFYLPIGLIGFVVFYFDYLVRHANGFNLGQINFIIQVVVFGSFSVLVYQLLRHRQLRLQDQATTKRILDEEIAFNNDRDQAIVYGATQIKGLADKMASQIDQIQVPEIKTLAKDAGVRLQTTIGKLIMANMLKGSHSTQLYVSTELDDLVAQALVGLEDSTKTKSIRIKTTDNLAFQTQSQDLLVFVLRTILDNAIAYSAQNGEVDISATLGDMTVSIAVVDHGSGIPGDKKFSLFQAFSKTEGAETFNHEGMGFSLYLDKLIMNYLVGDISVESDGQQGTQVILTLPQPLTRQ